LTQPPKNLKRDFFRSLATVGSRPDAGRASVFARARADQFQSTIQKRVTHAIQRLADSDPAGIRVVDIEIQGRRSGRQRFRLSCDARMGCAHPILPRSSVTWSMTLPFAHQSVSTRQRPRKCCLITS